MSTVKEMAYKIEDLRNDAEKINSLQNTLFAAIYKGGFAISTYEWAFVALGELTYSLLNELAELENEAFELIKTTQERRWAK